MDALWGPFVALLCYIVTLWPSHRIIKQVAAEDNQGHKRCSGISCTTCEELDSVNEGIAAAKAQLDRLMKRRQDLHSNFDDLHKTIIDRLPTEIAFYIFELAVRDFDYDIYTVDAFRNYAIPRLRLGAVCRNWRKIAWSAHHLWTTFAFEWGPNTKDSFARLAVEWLGRSGQLPLNVTLYANPDVQYMLHKEAVNLVIRAVIQCSHRWDVLHLHTLPPSMMSHFEKPHAAPCLRNLSLASTYQVKGFGMIEASPSSIRISGVSPGLMLFRWDNLTSLVAAMSVDDLLHILSMAPRLEDCDVHTVADGMDSSVPLPSVTHHRLGTLSIINHSDPESLGLFFAQLTCTALTELILEGEELPIGTISTFFDLSSCPLISLRLEQAALTGDDLVRITQTLHSLERLFIVTHEEDSPLAWSSFIHALSGAAHTAVSNQPLLPRLKQLICLKSYSFPWDIIPEIFFAPEDEVEGRRRPLEMFVIFIRCLVDLQPRPPPIGRRVLYQLLDLHDAGAKINIFIGYKNCEGSVFKLSFEKIRQDLEGERDWSTVLPDPSDILHFWDEDPEELAPHM